MYTRDPKYIWAFYISNLTKAKLKRGGEKKKFTIKNSLHHLNFTYIQALKHKLEKCIPNIRSSEPTFCQY